MDNRAPRPATYITDAVVLRLSDHGEADRIVTLLTAERGKVTAVAPGARRSRRRFGAALAPFGYGQAQLRERRGDDLQVLEALDAQRGFPHLTLDLSRLSHASYACELVRELCPPAVPEPEVLGLLLRLLAHLDDQPAGARPRAEPLRAFELQLLRAVGLQLSLSRCAACGVSIPPEEDEVGFDLRRGGVLCRGCLYGSAGGGVRLSGAVRAALLLLEQAEIGGPQLAAAVLAGGVLVTCRDLLLGVVQQHLGRPLKAVEFIAKMNQAGF